MYSMHIHICIHSDACICAHTHRYIYIYTHAHRFRGRNQTTLTQILRIKDTSARSEEAMSLFVNLLVIDVATWHVQIPSDSHDPDLAANFWKGIAATPMRAYLHGTSTCAGTVAIAEFLQLDAAALISQLERKSPEASFRIVPCISM